MKIENYRSSFFIHFLDSDQERSASVLSVMRSAGYNCGHYTSWTDMAEEVGQKPPHFIFFQFADKENSIFQILPKVRELLPESQIFLLCDQADLSNRKMAALLGQEIYDVLTVPLLNPLFAVRAVDRAAQLNYQIYLNEQLSGRITEIEGQLSSALTEKDSFLKKSDVQNSNLEDYFHWQSALFKCASVEDSIEYFLKGIAQHTGGRPVVYFHYLNPRRTLVARFGVGIDKEKISNVGLDLNQLENPIKTEQLRYPQNFRVFEEMLDESFGFSKFESLVFEIQDEIQGIFFFLGDAQKSIDKTFVEMAFEALIKQATFLNLDRRMHSNLMIDRATELFNRYTLLQKMSEEISRARRTSFAVSFLKISIDDYDELLKQHGSEDTKNLIRMLAKIIKKHSRVNDVVGRLDTSEFGLLLPHTSRKGGAIKAERLRRLIESANFSKFIKSLNVVTVSIGVSEYPTLCHDSDELLSSADAALMTVRKIGKNKVCMATVPGDFVADFSPREQ